MSFDHPLMDRNHPDLPKYPDHPKKPNDKISIKDSDEKIAAVRKANDDYTLAFADYRNKVAAYRDAMNKLEEDFWAKIEVYHGVQNAPEHKRSKLRSLAYEYGHASGYSDIACHYDDLADLIR